MNQIIEVKYEDKVLRPLYPLKVLKQDETAWIILCSRFDKNSLDELIGTLTKKEEVVLHK